jgi:hypothetical protein
VYKLRHESYDSNTLKNDIALFKMDTPVDTQHVCLLMGLIIRGKQVKYPWMAVQYILIFYALAWVTGWGTTSEGGQQASVLQELELGIVDDQTCYDAMTGALRTFRG